MLAENRIIAISSSCQLYFNWPPLTFGKMRSNRSHQPVVSVYLCLVTWPCQPACFIDFTAHMGPVKLLRVGGAGQRAWNNLVLWAEEVGTQLAKRAIPKAAAVCFFLASCCAVVAATMFPQGWLSTLLPGSETQSLLAPLLRWPLSMFLEHGEIKYMASFFVFFGWPGQKLVFSSSQRTDAYVPHALWKQSRHTNRNLQCSLKCLIQQSCLSRSWQKGSRA